MKENLSKTTTVDAKYSFCQSVKQKVTRVVAEDRFGSLEKLSKTDL